MSQILHAVYYMHEMRICHRDLKPENLMFASVAPIEESTLKIIDFGLSRNFTSGQFITTRTGSAYYVAPEVLAFRYTHVVDNWSCGVIMFVLFCGYPPFNGKDEASILAKVSSGRFEFREAYWEHVSTDAKDLIRSLLTVSAQGRCTAEQALSYDWMQNAAPKGSVVSLDTRFVQRLQEFRARNRFERAVMQALARQVDENRTKYLRDVFFRFDTNGDGLLSLDEFRDGLAHAGVTELPADMEDILESADVNGSGKIDYSEFLAASFDRTCHIEEDVCWSAFRLFDSDGDGKITSAEVLKVLNAGGGTVISNEEMAQIMAGVDLNGDGGIDFDEFLSMLRGPLDDDEASDIK